MSAESTAGHKMAKRYKDLNADLSQTAIHSASFTSIIPPDNNEKWLREMFNRTLPGVVLIPKWNRKMLETFLNRDE